MLANQKSIEQFTELHDISVEQQLLYIVNPTNILLENKLRHRSTVRTTMSAGSVCKKKNVRNLHLTITYTRTISGIKRYVNSRYIDGNDRVSWIYMILNRSQTFFNYTISL